MIISQLELGRPVGDGKRFDPVYFYGRRLCNVSRLKLTYVHPYLGPPPAKVKQRRGESSLAFVSSGGGGRWEGTAIRKLRLHPCC